MKTIPPEVWAIAVILAASVGILLGLPALAANGDYGLNSGANASSIQNKYATSTAVAAMLTQTQLQMVTPSPTPVTATSTPVTPTNTPGPFDPDPTHPPGTGRSR